MNDPSSPARQGGFFRLVRVFDDLSESEISAELQSREGRKRRLNARFETFADSARQAEVRLLA